MYLQDLSKEKLAETLSEVRASKNKLDREIVGLEAEYKELKGQQAGWTFTGWLLRGSLPCEQVALRMAAIQRELRVKRALLDQRRAEEQTLLTYG